MTIKRSNLDWARDIARVYRSALRIADPAKCEEIDELARARQQHWIAPTEIAAEVVDESFDEQMTAAEIERLYGVKAATIRSWARSSRHDPTDPSKPLLRQYPSDRGPLYVPREVLAVEGRHRRAS